MHSHSLFNRQAPYAPVKWAQLLLVGLLALLLSGLVLAYAEAPNTEAGDPGHLAVMVLEGASTTVAAKARHEEGPLCRHGHGEFTLPKGVLRVDQQEIEFEDALTVTTKPTTAPIPRFVSSTPRQQPPKPGLPIYLLTQRLRL